MPITSREDAVEVEGRIQRIFTAPASERGAAVRELFVEVLDFDAEFGHVDLGATPGSMALPASAERVAYLGGVQVVYLTLEAPESDRVGKGEAATAARLINQQLDGDLLLVVTNSSASQLHLVYPSFEHVRPVLRRMVVERDFGAVRGQTGHGYQGSGSASELTRLDALADGVSFLLGHNLIEFDLPFLRTAKPDLRLLSLASDVLAAARRAPNSRLARLALEPATARPSARRSASPSPAPNGSPHSPPRARCAPTARRTPGACTPSGPWGACRRSPAARDRAPPPCGPRLRCPSPSSRSTNAIRFHGRPRLRSQFAILSAGKVGWPPWRPPAKPRQVLRVPRDTRIAGSSRAPRQPLDLVHFQPRDPHSRHPQGGREHNAGRRLDQREPLQCVILARSPLRRGPVRLSGHETPLSAVAFAGRSIRREARNVRNCCGHMAPVRDQPCQPDVERSQVRAG